MYIYSGSGSFTSCTLNNNSAVSVVSCSWRCVFPSRDWRETGQSREADPVWRVCTLVLLVSLGGLYPRLFPSLVMLVGGVVCLPGVVLESVVSGVCPLVVSVCECCVLL